MDIPAVLFRWPDEQRDNIRQTSVYGLFSQVYPILLATIVSIASVGRTKLSLFEAHFAVAVSASPISAYVVYQAFYDACQHPRLFLHLSKDTAVGFARWLALILPFIWLAVNTIVSFSPTAFKNSHLCNGMTVPRWFEFQIVSNFVGVLDVMGRRDLWNDLRSRGGLGAVSVSALWASGVYFVRHLNDILNLFNARRLRDRNRRFYTRWPRSVHKAVGALW